MALCNPKILRRGFALCVAAFVLSTSVAARAQQGTVPSATRPADPPPLPARIAAVIDAAQFHAARWGIHIVDIASGQVVYTHDADRRFLPASNMKLFTTALALAKLGPSYRWRTSVYAAGRVARNGRLAGDLVLYGRGDPTFSERFGAGNTEQRIESLADQIAAAGIRSVTGSLIADESYYKGERFGFGWQWNDLQWGYGAEISALSYSDNVVSLRVVPGRKPGEPCQATLTPNSGYVTLLNRARTVAKDDKNTLGVYRAEGSNYIEVWGNVPIGDAFDEKVAVHNPAGMFGALLARAVKARGVLVAGKMRTMDFRERDRLPFDPAGQREVAFVESGPLADVVQQTNKVSQNLYAELLLRTVGRVAGPADSDSAERAGVTVLVDFLATNGVDTTPLNFSDGSGLSRQDLVTPMATVALLSYVRAQPYGNVFYESLPAAGVDGTLEHRYVDSAAIGKVRAKTGTLGDVSALSGYVDARSGRRFAFSVMVNNEPGDPRALRKAIDEVVLALLDQ